VNTTGEVSFEGAEGFHGGVSVGASALVVVGAAGAVEADLGDGDAVQGGVELPVAAAGEPVPAGLAGGRRDTSEVVVWPDDASAGAGSVYVNDPLRLERMLAG
jgi:hypothetical protein